MARSPLDDEALAVHHLYVDVGDVAQHHGPAVTPFQYQLAELPGVKGAGEAQRVAALAYAGLAGGNVFVASGEPGGIGKLDAQARGLVGVESDAHLALAAAANLGTGDARNPLEARLNDFLDVVLVALDVSRVAVDGLEDEPGDGAAAAAHGADDGLIGVIGIAGHAVGAVQYFQKTAPQILAHGKGDGDLALAAPGLGEHLGHARQAPQHLLLRLDDFRLDFFRRRRAPRGANGDLGLLDLGGELHRQTPETYRSEQHHQQHRDQRPHRIGKRQPGPAHY
jgi:hypothetical protein